MAENYNSGIRSLDPVVVEALRSITERVYQRRRPQLQDMFRRYYSMLDRESRDCAIAAFKHLKHGGYDFPPFLVRRWAMAHGWKDDDAQLLDDYAAGVVAGVHYHHSDPMGHHAIQTWQRHAEANKPWLDPGRPQQGVAFTWRD